MSNSMEFWFATRGWSVADRARFARLWCVVGDVTTRFAAVAEMLLTVTCSESLVMLTARYNELAALLRDISADRIAMASNYCVDLLYGLSFGAQ